MYIDKEEIKKYFKMGEEDWKLLNDYAVGGIIDSYTSPSMKRVYAFIDLLDYFELKEDVKIDLNLIKLALKYLKFESKK